MTHIALDLGLSTTGVAWPGGSDHFCCPAKLRGGERLAWWRDTLRAVLVPHLNWQNLTIVCESAFVHPKHITGAMNLIELHGVARLVAYDTGADYITVTPAELKRFATGKGNANKEQMVIAANERGCVVDDANEADAFLAWCWYADKGAAA